MRRCLRWWDAAAGAEVVGDWDGVRDAEAVWEKERRRLAVAVGVEEPDAEAEGLYVGVPLRAGGSTAPTLGPSLAPSGSSSRNTHRHPPHVSRAVHA